MKRILWIAMFWGCFNALYAQSKEINVADSLPSNSLEAFYKKNNPQLKYEYVEDTKLHNYSGNWDIDGDGRTEKVFFAGNGGAHLYYHLIIVLSKDKIMRELDFIAIDFPLLDSAGALKKNVDKQSPLPAFVVSDFDQDGRQDIYVHIDTKHNSIPDHWKKKGVTTGHLLISYNKNRFEIRDFPWNSIDAAEQKTNK